MKRQLILFAAIFILALSACKKRNKDVTVVRDCTGTYLRMDEKDYLVCNVEMIANYKEGEKINTAFKKIKSSDCPPNNNVVCLTVHANEGLIEIEKVNP